MMPMNYKSTGQRTLMGVGAKDLFKKHCKKHEKAFLLNTFPSYQ